jgi:hypothetical protein
MAGDPVEPSTYYFRTTPRFETGHESTPGSTRSSPSAGWFGRNEVGYRLFAVK